MCKTAAPQRKEQKRVTVNSDVDAETRTIKNLHTELTDLKGSGGLSALGRSESGGRSGKEGGNGELHVDLLVSKEEEWYRRQKL